MPSAQLRAVAPATRAADQSRAATHLEALKIRGARDQGDAGSAASPAEVSGLPAAQYGAPMAMLAPIEGELLRIDDVDTGFDKFCPDEPKTGRPYVVIGKPFGGRVRVVPQSTRGARGVYVPDGVVEGLKEGWFVPWSAPVRVGLAARCETIGYLSHPYLDQVREQWQRRKRKPEPDA